jgi:hypothetical protein
MSEETLSSARELRGRLRLLDCIVSVPALIVVATYLGVLLDLTASESTAYLASILLFGVASTGATEVLRQKRLRPLESYLEARAEGRPSSNICRDAFAATIALPKRLMQSIMAIWAVAPTVILIGVWIIGVSEPRLDGRLVVMQVAGLLGALISGSFVFFGVKHLVTDLRAALASDIMDSALRGSLVARTPLPRKLQLVVVGAVLGTSMLTITLAGASTSTSMRQLALDWQGRVLASIEPRLAAGASFEEALQELVPSAATMPYPAEFSLIPSEEMSALEHVPGLHQADEVAAALAGGERSGGLSGSSHGTIVWRVLPRGGMLLSTLSADELAEAGGGFPATLGLALLLSLGISLAVAFVMADDFKRATRTLCEEAERMAQGDLRRGRVWESED